MDALPRPSGCAHCRRSCELRVHVGTAGSFVPPHLCSWRKGGGCACSVLSLSREVATAFLETASCGGTCIGVFRRIMQMGAMDCAWPIRILLARARASCKRAIALVGTRVHRCMWSKYTRCTRFTRPPRAIDSFGVSPLAKKGPDQLDDARLQFMPGGMLRSRLAPFPHPRRAPCVPTRGHSGLPWGFPLRLYRGFRVELRPRVRKVHYRDLRQVHFPLPKLEDPTQSETHGSTVRGYFVGVQDPPPLQTNQHSSPQPASFLPEYAPPNDARIPGRRRLYFHDVLRIPFSRFVGRSVKWFQQSSHDSTPFVLKCTLQCSNSAL